MNEMMNNLRAVLRLEWIGEGHSATLQRIAEYEQNTGQRFPTPEWVRYYDRRRFHPWVARLTGMDTQFGFKREFLDSQIDYSLARGGGNRGVYLYYMLTPGIYEVNAPESWRHVRRYFVRVHDDLGIAELRREEVLACLPNVASE